MRPFIALLFPLALLAQTTGTLNLYPTNPANEQAELNQAVTEANGSTVDVVRVLEQHLLRYPNSPRRSDIEAALYKAATDLNDRARIIRYGDILLKGKPQSELEVLDRVIRAYLAADDADSATKALAYCARYEGGVAEMRARQPEGHATAAQWADLADRALARATVLEARASGNLGNIDNAIANARRSWAASPSAEAAHEIARWLVKRGKDADVAEAITHYADAVTVEDGRSPWSDRERDRKTVTDLYLKLHGGAEGLAEIFQQAWDRTALATHDRIARYKAMDANYGQTDPFAYVLPPPGIVPNASPMDTRNLNMATLRGKTVIIDYWATWCGPCIAEYPLIENVKKKYAASPDVVFLSLDADDDHNAVEPFIKAQNWDPHVYMESGLAGLLNVTSLPMLIVIDPSGAVHSRISGFNTESIERLLSARIEEARLVPTKPATATK